MTTTPITPTEFDLSDIEAVRKELTDSVTSRSQYTGLYADSTGERIRSASRIAFLASRIAWLESTVIQRAEWDAKFCRPDCDHSDRACCDTTQVGCVALGDVDEEAGRPRSRCCASCNH